MNISILIKKAVYNKKNSKHAGYLDNPNTCMIKIHVYVRKNSNLSNIE